MAANIARLTWTDEEGDAVLENEKPAPASRFTGWRTASDLKDSSAEALGDGVGYTFEFGPRCDASFALRYIPPEKAALVDRLRVHLRRSGIVRVETGDAADRTYPTCQLPKGAEFKDEVPDPRTMEIRVTLTLRNVAPSPTRMLCLYP